MADPIITVENLSKRFVISHEERERYTSLRDVVANGVKNVFLTGKRRNKKVNTVEDFWALKGLDFEIQQGDRVGIIGRNGAGKSTLLKVLSRITEPTTGRVTINGRVASLLEVGTGFHPELTGRENIFLNGAILGMSRAEIRKKFDEIVAFAEIEKFLDTPVKRYSSGMYVRLAFAVAAHLEPEILIVDEVLAVGDAQFQKKCLGKMEDVSRNDGRTVLFVSHNMAAIENLCSKAILLEGGMVKCQGGIRNVINSYQDSLNLEVSNKWISNSHREEQVYFSSIELKIADSQPNIKLILNCSITSQAQFKQSFIAFDISNSLGVPIMQAIPKYSPFLSYSKQAQRFIVEIELPPLIPDKYKLSVWIGPHYDETISWDKEIVAFDIHDSPARERNIPHSLNHGFIVPNSRIV
jgi:lipopolysaccharide transport system ATP-binding protein